MKKIAFYLAVLLLMSGKTDAVTSFGTSKSEAYFGSFDNRFEIPSQSSGSPDSHFKPVWIGNGIDQQNIYTVTAKIDGFDLKTGDEIGIFDGTKCVGYGTLNGTINYSNILQIVVSRDDGSVNGYTLGNKISYKFWDSAKDRQFAGITAEYLDPVTGLVITAPSFTAKASAFVKLTKINLAPFADAGVGQSAIEGALVTLDGSKSFDPNNDDLTYQWTVPAGISLNSTTVQKPAFTAPKVNQATNFTFSLVVYDGLALSASAQVTITVNPLPANAGSISGTTLICQGQSAVVYTVPAIPNSTSYVWTLPSGATGNSGTNSITLNYGTSAVSGNITVKGHNTFGDGVASTLAVTVNPTPITPIITQNGNIIHSDAVSGNQWFNQNVRINGAVSQDYTIIAVGEYTTVVTLNGCSSPPSNMIKDVVTAIDSPKMESGIQLYPNPLTDELTIEFKMNAGEVRYEIFGATGQLVTSGVFNEKTIVHTSSFPGGVYIIKLSTAKTVEYRKVIKNN